jgi:hypothetical protein
MLCSLSEEMYGEMIWLVLRLRDVFQPMIGTVVPKCAASF